MAVPSQCRGPDQHRQKTVARQMKLSRMLRRSAYAFPLLAFLALLLLGISEVSHRRAVQSLDELGRMGQVRTSNLVLLRQMVDAEAGQRGYLLTGREEYLTPYNDAIRAMRAAMDELGRYYAGDPEGELLMKELSLLVNRKLSEMEATLKLFREGKTDGALQLLLDRHRPRTDGGAAQHLPQADRPRDRQDRCRARTRSTSPCAWAASAWPP